MTIEISMDIFSSDTHSHARTHTHTHTHTHTLAHTHTHTHVHTHTLAHTYTHTHSHACTHTHTHSHARTHTHLHARTHTHTHTHYAHTVMDSSFSASLQIRLPSDVSDEVDEDPTGNRAIWGRGVLNGASQKVRRSKRRHYTP